MRQYLISIYQPDADPPPPEVLGSIMARLGELNEEMEQAGAWVFAAGPHPPHTATVIRDGVLTDGPFAGGKEVLGGFTLINAPDLDAALAWGSRMSAVLAPLAIGVRPVV